ncbi:hypothetical protein [Rhizohabitans arisaemae]|uniref:hypothetical protein n=1 Tax=Rhizohabitans arisaemae TaxID=2720610 RepID=UPI0024B27E34|nr:hypothetical protein [Rhizohabitans arisaemae]
MSPRRLGADGRAPRSLVILAASGLVLVTSVAIWALPGAGPDDRPLGGPGRVAASTTPTPRVTAGPTPPVRPSGFIGFVNAVKNPRYDLPSTARRTGARWFTLGYITALRDGCAPTWAGMPDNPVLKRVEPLRAMGGDAGLVFGGPGGPELAQTCKDVRRLTAAYRAAVDDPKVRHIDFEVTDSFDLDAVRRRARAVAALQRERPLQVTFTLPATRDGLDPDDLRMLGLTRAAGVNVSAVNLLSSPPLALVLKGAQAAHRQVSRALRLPGGPAWQRIGLTPVLAGPADLGVPEAERLVGFATSHGLAWLSLRGARPTDEVAQILLTASRRT